MIKQRIELLRSYMKMHGLAACIIPSSDPHQSEYVATHWESREWISGFTGSSGLIIITQHDAGLWTDSRYFIQAEEELKDTGIELHKVIKRSEPSHLYWLRDQLTEGETIAIDGRLFSKAQHQQMFNIISDKNIKIESREDFISEIWKDRPALPVSQAFEHDIKYAGLSRADKIKQVREAMITENADYLLVSKLDSIAWTLNLRGSDIRLNPVIISYLVIAKEKTYLFIDRDKLTPDIIKGLKEDKIIIEDYNSIDTFLNKIDSQSSILINKYSTSISHYQKLNCEIIELKNPIIQKLKGIKNDTECDNYRRCLIKDGVALTHAFKWLEEEIQQRSVSEYEYAKKIAHCRSQQDLYHDESFDAIVGYKGNGAIVHYKPSEDESALITNEGPLLVDSGGQYHDGTTDITRTLYFGTPSEDFKEAYTNVLKGMIGLSRARFPKGTTGAQIDVFARQHLWSSGQNYLHGTGHGVGFFLNVHEGPQGFSSGTTVQAQTPIVPGMVTSNEPGYYLEDHFGIRIENLILCVESQYEDYYEFETITYFPIDSKAIISNKMTRAEIDWINDYNQIVYDKLSPHLDAEAQNWLAQKCKSI